jgi:arginase family enzyme
LGFGDPLLSGVAGVGPKLLPGHVCLLGARSFEREEQALLARLGVRIFPMSEVLERGLATCFAEALALVRLRTAGFGVSVDLDALDPLDAPGVGSPVAGGIRGADLVAVLQGLAEIPGFCGLEVAELDPALDVKDATVRLVLDLVGAVWHAERGGPQ